MGFNFNEIATEKDLKTKTICLVIKKNSCYGVYYKGEFYPDVYLEPYKGKGIPVLETEGKACIFSPSGRFLCCYTIHKEDG